MISATIHSILNVPAKPPNASSRSLQWTPDGQLLVMGETIIYLLTPETGLNLDPTRRRSNVTKTSRGMSWLTTVISLQATELYWPEISQDFNTLCLGAVDYTWNAVTCSPTGCSDVGSCLLATLSSNLEVYLWAPKDNFYRGEWAKVQDITREILTEHQNQGLPATQVAISSQVQALCWSPQPDLLPDNLSMSLLALGTRAGTVLLLRLQEGKLNTVASVVVADAWITSLAWTSWSSTGNGRETAARLACALPGGRIALVHVVQTWNSSDGTNGEVITMILDEQPYKEDRRGITSMEWITLHKEDRESIPILIHCKPGSVELWREASETTADNGWSGLRSIGLTIQPTSVAATNFAQAAGIIYVPQHDILVISLVDGTYHAIHQVSIDPILRGQDSEPSICTSDSLSTVARSAFMVAEFHEREIPKDGSEPAKLYRNHVARTTGALGVDSGGVVLWIHQKIFAESFEYIPDSKIHCLIVAAPLISPLDYDQYAIQEIKMCLEKPQNFLLQAPISILRGTYAHLQTKGFVERNKETIIELLSPRHSLDGLQNQDEPMTVDDVSDGEWTTMASQKLSLALFANEELCRERLKVNIAMICSIALPEDTFKSLLRALEERIQTTSLLITFDWLKELPPAVLQESGPFFVSRMLRQARLSPLLGEDRPSVKAVSNALGGEVKDEEECPACGGAVEFTDSSLAKCENDHYWSRCSATSYILPTPNVLSCVCCGRKVMLPVDHNSTQQVNELLANVVLTAMQNCGMCGNKCVKTI